MKRSKTFGYVRVQGDAINQQNYLYERDPHMEERPHEDRARRQLRRN